MIAETVLQLSLSACFRLIDKIDEALRFRVWRHVLTRMGFLSELHLQAQSETQTGPRERAASWGSEPKIHG